MNTLRVIEALGSDAPRQAVRVQGWVRSRRDLKGFSFLEINDGSCLAGLQAVVDHAPERMADIEAAGTGACVALTGDLVPSQGKGQAWELRVASLTLLGPADPEAYPLQKKRHSDEFLRTIAHLRPRTNKYAAMLRLRSELSLAVHDFFRARGFFWVHTPILTGSDCEGAGEMFRVTSLPPGVSDPDQDFFGRPAQLTVSGQLEAELLATGLGRVYTFGPTFRAENSNTPRHAAEFWMVEPEMAFFDLAASMDLAEALLKHLVAHALDRCAADLSLFTRFVDTDLAARLETLVREPFARLPYREAMDILTRSGRTFEYPVGFGCDMQTEHERYLAEEHVGRPVICYDYPASLKPFYMRLNDDGETVAAMDVLTPRVGEVVGGSQREERLDVLTARMRVMHLPESEYWWYLDTRRFGSAPHSGFGLGLERALMLVTGVTNIRDVIAFPRTPRHLEF
ncbi:MAG: asparagine--tRNA ligase [Desulfovibrionaceae bacterium]